ncbi:protein asteroid homolog 1 [Thalassophryne amazonica]|uniref:protein asteroid homolog 1 n=1 Tax=Thalassophryne amazonica TaxID=390379 RepID=UPI0014715EE0|nr:protein asteroid homolog 1 [Thalassophryne amazonica]
MGVQGLTSYVEANRDFLQDVRFRDSRLVIDGCSLYFHLYFNCGLDQQHGGDYDAFSSLLSQFLAALASCNIQPYVVLDGGMDPSDKKFATLRQRMQSKIKEADGLCHGRHGCILPILTREVFIQVLIQRAVPLVQCPAEADWEIACLAHQWNCPVVTNDSDFYIFDLPGGYMPLRFFQWTNLNGKASQRYISARCYTTNRLCYWFGGMNPELLPLCAVLTGNDYGTPKDVETLLTILDVNESGGGGVRRKGRGSISRIEGLLMWLSSFSDTREALAEVSRLMGEAPRYGRGRGKTGEKGGLSSQLWAAMQEYHIEPKSTLARWFSGGKGVPGCRTSGFTQLPECLSLAAAKGLLAPMVLDALVMCRVLLIPQVENSKLASSHCTARALRQATYGILLQRDTSGQDILNQGRSRNMHLVKGQGGFAQVQEMRVQENVTQVMRGGRGQRGRGRGGGQVGAARSYDQILNTQGENVCGVGVAGIQAQSSKSHMYVEEYDRLDLNLKKNQVEVHPPRAPLFLDTLGQTPLAVRLGFMLGVLGVKETALASVPVHLRLAVAVTGFWLREASPPPSQLHLQALLLGIVYGELSFNQACASQCQYAEHNVWKALDRQRFRPGDRRSLDVAVAHCFSQWQACLWSALSLNHLLLLPLPEPHLSWLFSGTLVHGLLRNLRGGRAAESLLPQGSMSGQLYSILLDAVRSCSSKPNPSSSASGRRKKGGHRGRRGRGRGGKAAGGGARGTEEINNRFSLLMSEEESDYD